MPYSRCRSAKTAFDMPFFRGAKDDAVEPWLIDERCGEPSLSLERVLIPNDVIRTATCVEQVLIAVAVHVD